MPNKINSYFYVKFYFEIITFIPRYNILCCSNKDLGNIQTQYIYIITHFTVPFKILNEKEGSIFLRELQGRKHILLLVNEALDTKCDNY